MNCSKTTAKEQYIIDYFNEIIPSPVCGLNYSDYYELLVATILSAQARDVVVNSVTPHLFMKYPDINTLAKANIEDVKSIIRVIGLAGGKAQNIVRLAKIVVDVYQSIIPEEFDTLLTLPGVGRKVALVVRSEFFNDDCFPVDTHIWRIANRLGFDGKTPYLVEKDIMRAFPKETLRKLHLQFITFGRTVCTAKKPRCSECRLKCFCTQVMGLDMCKTEN